MSAERDVGFTPPLHRGPAARPMKKRKTLGVDRRKIVRKAESPDEKTRERRSCGNRKGDVEAGKQEEREGGEEGRKEED